MKNNNRYAISKDEDYEPGSNHEVIKNLLGIKSCEAMDQIEAQEYKHALYTVLDKFDDQHQFTSNDVCDIHKIWLHKIYPFAGKYRTVNISKNGFPFAVANYIPTCMKKFEQNYLAKYTPCDFSDLDELAYAIGVVHIEFILIHPFREGNGRVGRVLAGLMALQSQKPLLDFSNIDLTLSPAGFDEYISAIHAGVDGNYHPIQDIFRKILEIST